MKIQAHIVDARGVYLFTSEVDQYGPQPPGAIYDELPQVQEGHTRLWHGKWIQLPNSEVPEVSKPDMTKVIQTKIEALWTAADKYTSSYISGVAIGILTIGVLQQKPKALAVSAWSSQVWAEYYARKERVTVDSEDEHNFSSFGPIPYTVPELQEEIGI